VTTFFFDVNLLRTLIDPTVQPSELGCRTNEDQHACVRPDTMARQLAGFNCLGIKHLAPSPKDNHALASEPAARSSPITGTADIVEGECSSPTNSSSFHNVTSLDASTSNTDHSRAYMHTYTFLHRNSERSECNDNHHELDSFLASEGCFWQSFVSPSITGATIPVNAASSRNPTNITEVPTVASKMPHFTARNAKRQKQLQSYIKRLNSRSEMTGGSKWRCVTEEVLLPRPRSEKKGNTGGKGGKIAPRKNRSCIAVDGVRGRSTKTHNFEEVCEKSFLAEDMRGMSPLSSSCSSADEEEAQTESPQDAEKDDGRV
jgi:hypothetical protein